MRSNLKKMRIKRVSKKAPEWQQRRGQDRATKMSVIQTTFDMNMRKEQDDGHDTIHTSSSTIR
mgnify:CR=1 FL=1|jgi:hypothetical protein